MGVASRGPSMWGLAIWSVGAISLLLLAANSDSLAYVQRRMLLSAAPAVSAHGSTSDPQPLVGRVAGKLVQLPTPSPTATAYHDAFKRCRSPPADGDVALPTLKRVSAWEGADASRGGNTTVVTTLHVDRWVLPQSAVSKVFGMCTRPEARLSAVNGEVQRPLSTRAMKGNECTSFVQYCFATSGSAVTHECHSAAHMRYPFAMCAQTCLQAATSRGTLRGLAAHHRGGSVRSRLSGAEVGVPERGRRVGAAGGRPLLAVLAGTGRGRLPLCGLEHGAAEAARA